MPQPVDLARLGLPTNVGRWFVLNSAADIDDTVIPLAGQAIMVAGANTVVVPDGIQTWGVLKNGIAYTGGIPFFQSKASKTIPSLSKALPRLAPNPPTISYSLQNTATAISNPVFRTLPNAALVGGAQAFSTGNGNDQAGNPYLSGTAQTGNEFPVWFFAFQTDAPTMEIVYQGNANPTYRMLVDGYYVTPQTITAGGATSGQQHRMTITFPDRRLRNIEIQSELLFVSGIVVTAIDTIVPRKARRKIGWMGDSYSQNGGVNGIAAVATSLVDCDWILNASGGTGFNNSQSGNGGKQVFGARLPYLLAANPDYLVTCGGINDNLSTLASDLSSYLAVAKNQLLPERIIVCGPWTPPSQSASANTQKRDAMKAATLAAGCKFIDNVAEAWQTGTGYAGALQGDGNSDVYVGADGTHPLKAVSPSLLDGYTYLGTRMGIALASLIGI